MPSNDSLLRAELDISPMCAGRFVTGLSHLTHFTMTKYEQSFSPSGECRLQTQQTSDDEVSSILVSVDWVQPST